MTKAKITNKNGFKCAPEGHTVVTFPFGEIVEGQVAEWAIADRSASALFPPKKKRKPSTKALGAAPENK